MSFTAARYKQVASPLPYQRTESMPDKVIPIETARRARPKNGQHACVPITQEILEENLLRHRAVIRAAKKLAHSKSYIIDATESGASVEPGPLTVTVVMAGRGYRLSFKRNGVECTCYRKRCRCGT